MIKKRIYILTVIILVFLSVSLWTIFQITGKKKEGIIIAEIYRDNELVQEINLSEVETPYQLTLEYGDKDYNILQIEQGRIGIAEASCPDLLCKNMGFIDSSLMPITCLPNHLIIKVRVADEKEGTDGMTY